MDSRRVWAELAAVWGSRWAFRSMRMVFRVDRTAMMIVTAAVLVVAIVMLLVSFLAPQPGRSFRIFNAQQLPSDAEVFGANFYTNIFPVPDVPLNEQERRFERFIAALSERADATGDARLSEDIMTCIRMISSGDVASFLAEAPGLGIETHWNMTPDNHFWIGELKRARKFILRLRFHHDEIVIREDSGNDRQARDPRGKRPDIAARHSYHHPFVARIPEQERRHIEVLLPFTYLSMTTSQDTYGCLGLVLIWNTEVSRWVMIGYRSYQEPRMQPEGFPSPIF